MLFDRLCFLAERYPGMLSSILIRAIRDAHVFTLDAPPATVMRDNDNCVCWDKVGGVEFVMKTFFLPFRCIAIEDGLRSVLLLDAVEGQQGLDQPRVFAVTSSFSEAAIEAGIAWDVVHDPSFDAEQARDVGRHMREQFGRDAAWTSVGAVTAAIAPPESDDIISITGVGRSYIAYGKRGVYPTQMERSRDMMESCGRSILSDVRDALVEMAFCNLPSHFLIQVRRSGMRPVARGRIARSHQRPVYVLKTPAEIRAWMDREKATSNGGHSSPTPHWRRRHFRVLHSEKFVHKRGQVVQVSASWVGPQEFRDDHGHHYRVMVDH